MKPNAAMEWLANNTEAQAKLAEWQAEAQAWFINKEMEMEGNPLTAEESQAMGLLENWLF